ncbi:MAG: DNA primase DnaG [Candidatus Methanohalarchaeum thermophilum]|uniref:DNA primase DnaG n=1 Tax=Methanohalarchaeum thermophilum TaxID=1903181 RepID=A0A1Q6DS05_METT1|nr:MAG: DNA primase DnaG [Candidatus Methanohalarchaeum thermophilum]
MQNFGEAKYLIHAQIQANGVVEKPDVVGAIFGQTEGLIGENSDLRELQNGGRVGRIRVSINSEDGRSRGKVLIPSSLNKVETAVLAASLETIDRIGPCKAEINVTDVEDIRESKRDKIVDRAKEILSDMFSEEDLDNKEIAKTVKRSFGETGITKYKGLSSGPNVGSSDAILLVEGRSDVLNLLDYGVKNAIAIEGTDLPKQMEEISQNKTVTAFLDGDRGGDLILKEIAQRAEIDYVARAPEGKQVEELDHEEIMKALRNKEPMEDAITRERERKKEKENDRDKEVTKKKNSEHESQGDQSNENTTRSKLLRKAKKGFNKVKSTKESEENKKLKRKIEKSSSKTEDQINLSDRSYLDILDSLEGTLKAKLLNKEDEEVTEVAVRELANSLKKVGENVETVIFDGVVTQRLLDISQEKRINRVLGIKLGDVVKKPTKVEVITKEEI